MPREKTKASIVTEEVLSIQIGEASDRIDALTDQMNSVVKVGKITAPAPKIPFKTFERKTPEGILITVHGECATTTQSIKVILIRMSRNKQIMINGVLETVSEAVDRIQRESKHLTFELAVDENQAAAQFFLGEIGPLEPKKDDDDNKFQLLRLIAFDEKTAFAKNPAKNPFSATTLVTAPITGPGAVLGTGAGTLSAGAYFYKVTFVTLNAETDPSPSSNVVNVVAPGTNGKINLMTIPTGPAGSTRGRNIYRTKANGTAYFFVSQINNNTTTTFTDNVADVALTIPIPTTNTTGGLPVPTLIVDNDDAMTAGIDERYFFTVGNSVADLPGAPSLADIVCNRVNLETPAADASVTVKVKTATGMSFGDANVQGAMAVFKKVSDPAIPAMPTAEQDAPIKLTAMITDPSATEILLQGNFDLGIQYEWVRNVFTNASGKEKAVGVNIQFFAGGTQDLTQLVAAYIGQPGASADGRLKVVVTQESPQSSTVTAFFTQPAAGVTPCAPETMAALFRRVRFLKQRASGVFVEKYHFPGFTDETLFTPGEHSVSREIQHKPNQTGINFRVELVAVGPTPATKITADSNGNSSVLAAFPIDPIPADVSTLPDGDTEAQDAYVDVIIWTSLAARNLDPTALKFRELGIEQVFFAYKRLKSSASDALDNDDPDTKYTHCTAPVPSEDMDATKTIIRLRGLRLSRKYRIRRTGFIGMNSVVQSAGSAPVNFTAGTGTLDIAGITVFAPTVTRQDKQHSQVVCQLDQPAAGAPVALKNLALLRHRPNDVQIVFGGGGLNDMTVGGTWTTVDAHNYIVTLSVSTGSPDKFSATRDGVVISTNVSITGALQTIGPDGVQIKFGAVDGHTLNNTWTFTAMFREIDRKVLRNNVEYSDNTSGTPPITDPVLKNRKFVEFEVKHKQNTNGIQYAYILLAIGNASKTSAITTQGSTGNDAPNFQNLTVPAIPRDGFTTDISPGDFVTNQPNGDPAMPGVETVIRGYSTEARASLGQGGSAAGGAISFDDIGADTFEITIVPASDMAGTKRLTFGGIIPDTTAVFVDINCPGLTFGELYAIKRYTVAKGGASVSQANTIWFRAGGSIDLTGVTLSIISVALQNTTQTLVTVRVQQPANRVILFKNLQIARAQGSPLGAQKEVANSRVVLRDDSELYIAASPGTFKDFEMSVNHKKNINIQYQITLIGLKGAIGGSAGTPDRIIVLSVTGNTGDEATFSDTAKPAYTAGRTPKLKFRWKPTAIRVKFRPPDLNMNTHVGNFIACKIFIQDAINGQKNYTFNASDNSLFTNDFFLSFNQANPDDDYYAAIDKNSLAVFPFDRPDQDTALPAGNGDLSSTIVSQIRTAILNSGFAELSCEIYVQNRYTVGINYCLILSANIRWDVTTRSFIGQATHISFG